MKTATTTKIESVTAAFVDACSGWNREIWAHVPGVPTDATMEEWDAAQHDEDDAVAILDGKLDEAAEAYGLHYTDDSRGWTYTDGSIVVRVSLDGDGAEVTVEADDED